MAAARHLRTGNRLGAAARGRGTAAHAKASRDVHVNAIRAEHETTAATDEQTAARHRQLARIWRALETKATQEAAMFATVQDTRRQWEAITEPTRRIAIAADLELRRRHPAMRIEPLRAASTGTMPSSRGRLSVVRI